MGSQGTTCCSYTISATVAIIGLFGAAVVRFRAHAQRQDGRDAARTIRACKGGFRNVYVVVRHGQSKANVAELIVSDPDIGIAQYGLTSTGEQQASAAGDLIAHSLTKFGSSGHTIAGDCTKVAVLASDFARARETAQIVCERISQAGISSASIQNLSVTLKPQLRERFFGSLDGKSAALYEEVWKHDIASVHHTYKESESIASVLARTTKLILETEATLQGHVVLLVAHGDVNQILRSAFRTHLTPSQHRSDEHLSPASARALNCDAFDALLRAE